MRMLGGRATPAAAVLAFVAAGFAAAQTPEQPGVKTFRDYCAACHRYDGQGMGEAPPLHESPWVNGPAERLIKIVLHGVRGRMEVQGEIYDREMPGFGGALSDKAIAELLSFIRKTFGEQRKPIAEEQVRRVREGNRGRVAYWHVDELRNDK